VDPFGVTVPGGILVAITCLDVTYKSLSKQNKTDLQQKKGRRCKWKVNMLEVPANLTVVLLFKDVKLTLPPIIMEVENGSLQY